MPTNVSGADFVPAAVVTDRAAGTKFANWSLGMMPAGTFVDPANTATLASDDDLAALYTQALGG